MKNILTIIISVLVCCYSFGQDQVSKSDNQIIELSENIPVDTKVRATKKIVLKHGFSVKSKIGFSAKIFSDSNTPDAANLDKSRAYDIEYVATQKVKVLSHMGAVDNSVLTTVNYYNGFGNKVQSHLLNATADGRSFITFSDAVPGDTIMREYAGFAARGRGAYMQNIKAEQFNYYQNNTDGIITDNMPYTETVTESSPLQRVFNSRGIGQDQDGHNSNMNYGLNEANQVPMFQFNGTNWVYNGYYPANTHFLNRTTDENGKQALSATNSIGQTVMTKSGNVENWFIYDDFGRIVHTIPSAAVDIIKQSGAGYIIKCSGTPLNEFIYSYRYSDDVSAVTEKFLPGIKGSVEYVYDKLGRLVLSRNIKLKNNNRWSFIKYDKFGRVIITGSYKAKGNHTREQLQQLVLNSNAEFFEVVDPIDYQILAIQDNMNGTKTDKHTVYYSSNVFPAKSFTDYVESIQYDVITVYDKYHIPELHFKHAGRGYEGRVAKPTGQITSKAVRIEGGVKAGTYNKSAFYYNKKGELISTVSTSIFDKNILNRTHIKYNFSGNAEKSLSLYNRKLKSGAFDQMEISQYHAYDRMGLLLSVDQEIAGDANGRVTMATYEYDAVGQLKTTKLHKKADGTFLQTVDYAYNIRGQLTDINNVNDKNSNDVFAMHINYTKQLVSSETTAKQLWNGYISSVEWRSGDSKKQAYAFEYDDYYRLTDAKYAAGDNLNEDVGRFNMHAEYDNMGNITLMQRNGGANGALIDDLTYNYAAADGTKGNKLLSVTDASTNSFKDQYGFGKPEGKFWYDDLGNLIADSSREVYSIEYNNQNLPIRVILFNGKEISYNYTAEGVKLTRVVYNPYTMKSIYTRYEAGFVYETDQTTNKLDLKYFAHTQEGRVVVNNSKFSYEYFIKDHQGNIRATIGTNESGNLALLQTTDYYPFGLTMANGNKANTDQPYQYGGKEWQNNTQVYDFHARQYNPALGRWFNLDPRIEDYTGYSPYNYCKNNPLNLVDKDGMKIDEDSEDRWNKLKEEIKKRIAKLKKRLAAGSTSKKSSEDGNDKESTSSDKETKKLKNRILSLEKTLEGMERVENDPYYRFHLETNRESPQLKTKDGENMIIAFTGKTGSFVHEVTHGIQLVDGDLNFTKNEMGLWDPGDKYGVNDEIGAYKSEFAYSGRLKFLQVTTEAYAYGLKYGKTKEEVDRMFTTVINNFEEITPREVNKITQNGSLIYNKVVLNKEEWNAN
ncbi:MAG: RHS repeat-associated core domain-containing protein [Bacteroidales bacterium]|jgi:RHS repeat-associated protein|nr:RHS repeat-associated core domain-containing protein [Bacteroidales bacterium]